MELLIAIILALIVVIQLLSYRMFFRLEKEILGVQDKPKEEEPKVTDPFQKPKEIYSSTSHIVVPKTPTEIRNQNFKKIKEGVEYGDIRRD